MPHLAMFGKCFSY